MPRTRPPYLLVAGGGTGGHVFAGVSIAEEWKKHFEGHDPQVLFVGARGGIEEIAVPRTGLKLELLDLGALKGVSTVTRLKTLFKLPLAFIKSTLILFREKPQVVVGVGGYASGPMVLMARILSPFLKVRTYILEQNAVPGFTNRVLMPFCHRVLYAFPVEGVNPKDVTGNPTRKSILPAKRGEPRPLRIFIFGGSQGAVGINNLVLGAIRAFEECGFEIELIHQTGEKDHLRVIEEYKKINPKISVRIEKFIHDMPACYEWSSLIICRAGSSTLAELAIVGRAAILVPFPFAADDHQDKNAQIFERAGAARILRQKGAKSEDLVKLVIEMASDPDRLRKMEAAMRAFSKPDAAATIVNCLTDELQK